MPGVSEKISVIHLNIIGFRAAVAWAKDKTLRKRPFVIAGAKGGRSLALDCSPEAVKQGVLPGTPIVAAERMVKDLIILPPDPPAYELMNSELEKTAAHFAPVWENDRAGNLYLDVTGTSRIFGPPIDHANRILKDISEQTSVYPAIAVASNKLVSKVATRVIRPFGLVEVDNGGEAVYLAHKDIRILPGMGPNLLRIASAVGMREIGDIAELSASEAVSLFGKQGPLLRNMARGIDGSRVLERGKERKINRQLVFSETVIEDAIIRGALEALAENGGLEMRSGKMGMRTLHLAAGYSDGLNEFGVFKSEKLLISDREIMSASWELYQKTVKRRIRIRSIGICLDDLTPLGFEPDLFEAETDAKNRKLQEAVDSIQKRYGAGTVTRGPVLEASKKQGGNRLLTGSSNLGSSIT